MNPLENSEVKPLIRIGICDDRSEDIQTLQAYAAWFGERHPEFPLTAEAFSSPFDLLQAIRESGGYDVYLLDIIMPHLNGIDVAQKVRERGETAELLFLTTSREYAVEAFSVKASGYLIKPVQKMDFEQEMLHCIQNLAPKENPAILLKTKEGIRRMHIREIVMVESFNHSRVCILSDGTKVETSATLSSLYERLREYPCFFLPHRAYIVNLDYVNGLTPTELMMAGGQRVPVSRNIYPKLKEAYMRYAF